ncbi:hypothetical protein J3R74_000743 [Puniceicoccus vermicola]
MLPSLPGRLIQTAARIPEPSTDCQTTRKEGAGCSHYLCPLLRIKVVGASNSRTLPLGNHPSSSRLIRTAARIPEPSTDCRPTRKEGAGCSHYLCPHLRIKVVGASSSRTLPLGNYPSSSRLIRTAARIPATQHRLPTNPKGGSRMLPLPLSQPSNQSSGSFQLPHPAPRQSFDESVSRTERHARPHPRKSKDCKSER